MCVTTAQGDEVCAEAIERGTIVQVALPTSAENVLSPDFRVSVFPNPVIDKINVAISGRSEADVSVQLVTLNGQVLNQRLIEAGNIVLNQQIATEGLPKGIYLVKIQSAQEVRVEKVVIQ
ncbi:MAG: T9SS type A sorting domain-containing protein [Bacteroidota bacterium]